MKVKRHIKSFNEHGENLNISDVRQRFNESVKDWYSIYSQIKKSYIGLKDDVLNDVAKRKEDFNDNWMEYIEYEHKSFIEDQVEKFEDNEFTEEEVRKVANQVIKDWPLDI
jgi:hypothetical protein